MQATMTRPTPSQVDAATAGFLNTDWNPRDVPAGTATRNVVLRTEDGAATSGSLYVRGSADSVVCIMHPREFMVCHYLIPDIVDAGFAAWSQSPRSVGSDLRLEHEFALYDVAAGLRFLREAGIRNIVRWETPAAAVSTACTSSNPPHRPKRGSRARRGDEQPISRSSICRAWTASSSSRRTQDKAPCFCNASIPRSATRTTRLRSTLRSIPSILGTDSRSRRLRRAIPPSSSRATARRESRGFVASMTSPAGSSASA